MDIATSRPPWIRVFQVTMGYPFWLPWRHVPRRCRCGQAVTFGVWTTLPGRRNGRPSPIPSGRTRHPRFAGGAKRESG